MYKLSILLITVLTLFSLGNATYSRLYYGELDARNVAGIDSRVDFGPFFAGADVRTLFPKTIIDQENNYVGTMPDRTDYKTSLGIVLWAVELEYAHTCYHRVISGTDLSLYQDNQNPANTDYIALRWRF